MDIDKQDRATLKSYFVKNAVPTQDNFAKLIEGALNQKDDGVAKLPNEPLSVQAEGDDASMKKVINFYRDFTDAKPAWTLSLNPRGDPVDPKTSKPGWSIGDADGNSRLFIDQASGNIGVGTVEPREYRLNVNGPVLVTGNYLSVNSENAGRLRVGAVWGIPGLYSGDDGAKDLVLGVPSKQKVYLGYGKNDAFVEGDSGNAWFRGNVGIGMTDPKGKLEVVGAVAISNGTRAAIGGKMASGSLSVGSTAASYGGGKGWDTNTNIAALLLETNANTEIAVNEAAKRVASLMYYEGGAANRITIGRDMGFGAISQVEVSGVLRARADFNISKDSDSKMTYGGTLVLKGNAPQIDFVDTDNNDWSIHVNSNKMYFIREPWNYQDLVLDGAGNVGIGTDAPGAKLDVRGDVKVSGSIACGGKIWIRTYHNNTRKYIGADPNTGVVYAGPNKDIWESFTLEMGCSRDIKENILPLSGEEAIATLQALNPVKYDYKGERLFRQNLGFIAEEMPDNLASENRKSISPFEITPVLARVVQEQHKLLTALKETVTMLERERHA
jgi:hypothetical protein